MAVWKASDFAFSMVTLQRVPVNAGLFGLLNITAVLGTAAHLCPVALNLTLFR